ncbi:MAG: hypothetical protein V3W37_08070 [Candidatus Binatia bacterium]
MGQLPSAKDTVASDTTTSATYEDIDGLTVQLTVDDQSDILLMASVQAIGSATALAGFRLVFDGTNFLEQERSVNSEPANITFFDRVVAKGAGTYTFKLQHKVASGTLTTENAIIVAVSLHSGNGAVPANSVYVATDTVGNAWEDIPGLTADVTLSKTSHIAAFLCWHGSHSANNRDGLSLINIDGVDGPIHARNFDPSGNVGQVFHIDRTLTKKTAGTYTVKGRWKGTGGSTLTGNDFTLVIIAGEANSGTEDIDIQQAFVATDTTTATAIEDVDGLSVTASPGETAHILAAMSMRTDVSLANTSAYTTASIDGTDHDVMERGHVSAAREGSVGQFARTDSPLAAGDYTVKGRWFTDSGNTLVGDNIELISIVLAASGAAAFELLCDTGTYSAAGQDAVLKGGFKVPSNFGIYTLSGQDAIPKGGFRALSDFGTYALTGQDAILKGGFKVPVDFGTYALTGVATTLLGGFRVLSDFGTYSLAGQAATLKGAFKFLANTGAYSLVGVDADLRKGFLLAVDTGVYAVAGQNTNLLRDLVMLIDTGAYTVAGIDAVLKGSFGFLAETGTYSLVGIDANLFRDFVMLAELGAYSLSGVDTNLLLDLIMVANTGAYLISGVDTNLLAGRVILADQGVYVITGQAANLIFTSGGHPDPLPTKVAWRFSVRRKRES